jgi:SPX domain protein involved in polyphosphate accumulation
MEKISEYRYERKFFVNSLSKYDIESIIKLHPAKFSELYHQRFVNNIYLDSSGLNNYFDNIQGNMQRTKTRIRWYGKLFGNIETPILEFKIKNGLLGRKSHYSLNSFSLDNTFNIQKLIQNIQNSKVPIAVESIIKYLKPTLLNRYSRRYFISNDKQYRITIDSDQVFYKIGHQNNSFKSEIIDNTNIILELKYDVDAENNVNSITNHFPFRLTKSSKYIAGIERLYGSIHD